MSKVIVDLTDDDDTLKKVVTFINSFINQPPAMFTEEEIAESNEIQQAPALSIAAQVESPRAQPAVNPHKESTAEVDKAGYPWDGRIHAGTKTKTTKGVWKLKRGIDAALITSVQAEIASPPVALAVEPALALTPDEQTAATAAATFNANNPDNPLVQALNATQPVAPVAVAPVAPVAPVAVAPVAPVAPVAVAPVAVAPVAPVAVAPVAVAPAVGVNWPELLQRVTTATQAGTLNQDASNNFLTANGITGGLALLATRPDLFDAYIREVGV